MNKTEWDASNDPLPMLDWLHERGSERKFRLFACACMKRQEDWLVGYYHEAGVALEAARRIADGKQTTYAPPRHGLWTSGAHPAREIARMLSQTVTTEPGWEAARVASRVIVGWVSANHHAGEGRAHAALLRDLFGHLFHPDPLWLARLDRADDVERVARAIYDDHSFADLPVLGDALEDAGCNDPAVLEHCREPGEHARGCWVLDALLGRQ